MKLWKKILLALAALVVLAIIVGGAGVWLLTKFAGSRDRYAKMSEAQLKEAIAKDPKNIEPHRYLGLYYSLKANRCQSAVEQKDLYRASNKEYKAAYDLGTDQSRGYVLQYLAWAAWRAGDKAAAGRYAGIMVKDTSTDWNHDNNIHHGHTILGLVAIGRGDVKTARSELTLSGAVTGSPQLKSVGPQMTLAKALLDRGDKEAVINYFAACEKFWRMDWGKLKKWTKMVRAGERPDFGGNLIY